MKKLLFILLFNSFMYANYIETAIIACHDISEIKVVEPHVHKDSNKYYIPLNCLILTKNAQIEIIKFIDEKYVLILIKELGIQMYTLSSTLKTY